MVRNKSESHMCCGDPAEGFEDDNASSYDSRHEYVFKIVDEGSCHGEEIVSEEAYEEKEESF